MKVLIFTGSPNKDGLTAACAEQARLGILESGAEAKVVSLNESKIGNCQACNNGWGSCFEKHVCQTIDGFQSLLSEMKDMDAFVFITPVYWGDLSESTKAFTDRLRRCVALNKEDQLIAGKPVICVAAAGASGYGFISCLAAMERFIDHVKGKRYDFIGITRRSREYKLRAIFEAAKSMTESLKR